MRTSKIKDLLTDRGAVFTKRAGVEIVKSFGDPVKEYNAVRKAVGLCDFSFMTRHRVPEDGLDMLEQYAAGPVAAIRFGRVLHTMALNDEGLLESDLYIANDDEEMIVLGESLVEDDQTAKIFDNLNGKDVGLEDISQSTAVFGLDGCNAWAVAKDLFGPDVLGLPYLSIENYELQGVEIKLIRAGKTSEFGYLLLVPANSAEKIWTNIEEAGVQHGLELVGADAHSALRLDGRFFNIHEEGAAVRDPLPLGLQWMIDMEGDAFRGSEALLARRTAGLVKKIIGVMPADATDSLEPGQKIFHAGHLVAEVVTAAWSPALNNHVGLALFGVETAYAGLELIGNDGKKMKTISMPPITAKSLSVKLDEM